MNTAHPGPRTWKARLSSAADRTAIFIERVCIRIADVLAAGLHKLGLHDVASVLSDKPARS